MGITIHYRGRLDDKAALPSLMDEMKDMAESMDWQHDLFDDDWSQAPDASFSADKPGTIEGNLGLKGIMLTPQPDSEALVLLFERDGNLCSPINMIQILEGALSPDSAWIHMKTQFAAPDLHIWLVGLLKYLKRNYISNLEVSDESGYWETGDRAELERKMAFIDGKIKSISSQLASPETSDWSNLSPEEIADRIEQMLRAR